MRDAAGRWDRFWFGRPVEPVRWHLFRVLFFGTLALDSWLKIVLAGAYGAGGFNAAHFAWIDRLLPLPGARLMTLLWLLQAYLALRLALGSAGRWAGPLLAGLFGVTYFVSQIDTYQHHYLLFLLLVILAGVRWHGPAANGWALRLVTVQISIVYFWAAVAKLHPIWLDGTVVSFCPGPVQGLQAWAAARLGLPESVFWPGLAWSGLLLEIFLAVAIHVRRLRGAAVVLGVGFHLAIELLLGIKIGLFSWYMVVLYLLVLPDRWLAALAGVARSLGHTTRIAAGAASRRAVRLVPTSWQPAAGSTPAFPAAGRWLAWAGLLLLGSASMLLLPLEGMPTLALLSLAAALMAEVPLRPGRLRRGAAHLTACTALLVLNQTTEAATARYTEVVEDAWRRQEPAEALQAARRALATAPAEPELHRLLAAALERAGQSEAALASLDEAVSRRPTPAEQVEILVDRSFLLHRLGRREEAYLAAQEALRLDPDTPRLPDDDPVIRELRRRMKAE